MRRMNTLQLIVCGVVTAGALVSSHAAGRQPVIKAAPSIAVDRGKANTDIEVIRQRHPNRTVKIEREVIRDADDNYVNHGAWKMWDNQGELVAEGRYRDGKRQGDWTAWFLENESKLFAQAPFKHFQAPFVSRTTFEEGRLHGVWTIHDAQDRKVCEWNFSKGERHGSWTSWYPGGQKMRRLQFHQGELQGETISWDRSGKVAQKDSYESGRRLSDKVEHFSKNEKKSEGVYLLAKQELAGKDDWWNCELAKFEVVGKDERHGPYKEWYRNGQLRGQGTYEYGQPTGLFTWWYENGQRSVEGHFDAGRKIAQWTWWHKNGQKSIDGEYEIGAPHGNWIWWNIEGKVAQRVEYSSGGNPGLPGEKDLAPQAIVKGAKDIDSEPKSKRTRVVENPSTKTRLR